MSARFGGKIFFETQFNATSLTDLGLSGNMVFDPVNGWCNSENGAKCNAVSNGTTDTSFTGGTQTTISEDLQGFAVGTPGWVAGFSPANRLDMWLTVAGAQKTLMLEDPVIIEDHEVIDIANFIAIALYQEHGSLDADYRELLEYLSNHYFRERYYQHLVTKGEINCHDPNCRNCGSNHKQCNLCVSGYGLDPVFKTCKACSSPGCTECGADYKKCDICPSNLIKVGTTCVPASSDAATFILSMENGPDFSLEKYGPQNIKS